MRVTAILLMASLLVGETTSAVPARAWTADAFPAGSSAAAPIRTAGESSGEWSEAAQAPAAAVPLLASGATLLAAADSIAPRALFPVVTVPDRSHRPTLIALGCAATGAALVGASFAWKRLGDRRYDAYLAETDPARIESRWQSTRRADQLSNASLIGGELLLVSAVWLRFVRHAGERPVSVRVSPLTAAVAVRW